MIGNKKKGERLNNIVKYYVKGKVGIVCVNEWLGSREVEIYGRILDGEGKEKGKWRHGGGMQCW